MDELVDYFRQGERSSGALQVGLEHEKLVYPLTGASAVPYEGERGIGALLTALGQHGFEPFRERPELPVIALTKGAETISLEPGGQLELSGTPARTALAAHQENLRHLALAKQEAARLGLRLVALGYRPFDRVEDMPWMPKSRYGTMRQTLGARGRLALRMMLMTATGQVSLDWIDEADCVRKVSLVSHLTPILVALYANSPLVEGRPSGFMSYRSHVWTEVDTARCGYLPSVFDGSFSYRAYVEWALDAPLLFLRRKGQYLAPKLTFRQLLKEGYEQEPALHSDWVDHLSTLFPEVRIKRVLEVRGADAVGPLLTGALAALWRGLLYDKSSLGEAESLGPKRTLEEQQALHAEAQRKGLRAKAGFASLSELAVELVEIARRGLARLDPLDVPLLDPLAEVARSGRSPAERVLEEYEKGSSPQQLLAKFEL